MGDGGVQRARERAAPLARHVQREARRPAMHSERRVEAVKGMGHGGESLPWAMEARYIEPELCRHRWELVCFGARGTQIRLQRSRTIDPPQQLA